MKRQVILGIVFFGTLWGVSEVFLGETLYRAEFRYSSVSLSLIAIILLSIARHFIPGFGTATLIACCAALYKLTAMAATFLGTPIYFCHLLGIVTFGVAYDLAFLLLSRRSKAVCAVATSYLGYALFAVIITYVVRYHPWVSGGWEKVWKHVSLAGSLTAIGAAVLVPLTFHVTEKTKLRVMGSLPSGSRKLTPWLSGVTVALWIVGIALSL